MASYPYPPWSAPASLKKDKSSWWKNTKQALKRHWPKKQKSKDHISKSNSADTNLAPAPILYNPYNPFSPEYHPQQPAYPNFDRPQFAPGNIFHPQFGGNYHPQGFPPLAGIHTPQTDDGSSSTHDTFEVPEVKPTRPSLKGIFPQYNTPLLDLEKPQKKSAIIRRHSTGGVHAPLVSSKPQQQQQQQRPLRSSEQSVQSDGVGRQHRRDLLRGIREIPVLPRRDGGPYRQMGSGPVQQKGHQRNPSFDHDDNSSSSQSSSEEPYQQDRTAYSAPHRQPPPARKPLSSKKTPPPPPPPGGFSFQPHAPPLQNQSLLQELQDEIEEEGSEGSGSYEPEFVPAALRPIEEEQTGDEIKGFDGFMMY